MIIQVQAERGECVRAVRCGREQSVKGSKQSGRISFLERKKKETLFVSEERKKEAILLHWRNFSSEVRRCRVPITDIQVWTKRRRKGWLRITVTVGYRVSHDSEVSFVQPSISCIKIFETVRKKTACACRSEAKIFVLVRLLPQR